MNNKHFFSKSTFPSQYNTSGTSVMGVGLSVDLASSISIARTWSWERVNGIIDVFLEEEHDFNLENIVVEKLTGMNSAEADALVVALTRRVDSQVNGITLLTALILLAEEKAANVEQRITAVYRLMDFDSSGEITMEEMGIVLFCLAMASSFIIQRHRLCPTALEIKQINEAIFAEMGKQVTSCITRDEFVKWAATSVAVRGESTTIFDVYKYFVTATGNEAMKKDVAKVYAAELDLLDKKEKEKAAAEEAVRDQEAARVKKADEEEEGARVKAEQELVEKEAARLIAVKVSEEEEAAKVKAEQQSAALEKDNEKQSDESSGSDLLTDKVESNPPESKD